MPTRRHQGVVRKTPNAYLSIKNRQIKKDWMSGQISAWAGLSSQLVSGWNIQPEIWPYICQTTARLTVPQNHATSDSPVVAN